MKQSTLEALLGRPLTPTEATNRTLYLKIALAKLETLLCLDFSAETETRTFQGREGYSTIFTDIFTKVDGVTVNGESTSDYHAAFWDKRSGELFNSIVLDNKLSNDCEIQITAEWGLDCLPLDLQQLQAQMFAIVSAKYSTQKVKSKRVEDFSITYSDMTAQDTFAAENAATIRKYSMCNIGQLRSGKRC